MKVLYIIHATIMGGSTISFKNMIDGVVKRGIKPIIVYPRKQYNGLIADFEKNGIECIQSFVCCSILSNRNFFKNILSIGKLLLLKALSFINLLIIVGNTKPDIVHTNTGVVHEGFMVARLFKIPHVWHIREYQTLDFNWKIYPRMEKFIKKISKSYPIFITKDLQNFFKQERNNSIVIYNPIYDLEDIRCDFAKKKKYFLVANRISKEKGIEDIIRGYAEFAKHNETFSLKIAGFGDETYINELKTLCSTLNVEKRVEFLGFVPDMRNLIQEAEVLLVGSYFEGFGRMTAEANLLGTYVIGRKTGGTKEIIELTHGGCLFDEEKEIPILLRNYTNKPCEEKMAFLCDSQKIAFEHFSKQKHCSEIIKLYNSILSNDKVS